MRFDPKISTLEERDDIDSISMDELHGIFTAYEMRIEQENPGIKEAAFKASKRSKQKSKQKEKEYIINSDISEDDEEVSNLVRRLKKGTDDRYKGKLPLICFNCDGIGHFANKCPYKKKKRNDEDDSNRKQTYKGQRTKNKAFKKSFYTKEDSSSSDEYEINKSETERLLFMAIEYSDKEDTEEEYEEVKVDYREECCYKRFASPYAILHIRPFSIPPCRLSIPICKIQS
jgi:hypothetical protein